MKRFLWLLILLALASCGERDSGSCGAGGVPPVPHHAVIGPAPGGTADPDGGLPAALTISGKVTYERLPVTPGGLDLLNPVVENASDVLVEAVAHSDINNVLGTATTDANGDYTLNFSTTVDYFVRARARSGAGLDMDAVYHSQTSPPIVHALPGEVLNRASGSQTVNLHGAADAANRAGAFAVLDTVQRLRAASTLTGLGPLDLFWGMGNAGTRFLANGSGQSITLATETGLDGPNGNPSIYLLGGDAADVQNSDHDEFDETVIAHEWASFLQLTQSRDNNFGGPHFGEELIFSASYSEGMVTAIGCALAGQSVYRDTLGYTGGVTSVQFEFDCESGLVPGSGTGYGNEFRVTRVVWDLFDGGTGSPPDTDADPSNIGMADFLASFADLRARAAPFEVAWLASLLQELIDDARLSISDANTIMATHGASFPPAGGDGFPPVLTVGGAADMGNLDAWSGTDPNPILGPQANGLWRMELAGAQTVSIDVTNTTPGYNPARHRLDLTVHDLERNVVAQHIGDAANKSVSVSLMPGTYLVRVQHAPATQADSQPASFMVQAQ
ncbi:MAG: hypothetical protein K8I27_10255 [Planctomycetes bacterium]|nr:hypothetical protein [Planctomycetota bacterium]